MRVILGVLAMALMLPVFAQKKGSELLDSFRQVLPSAKEDSNKVKLLMSITQLYVSINPKEGFRYAEDGIRLSEKLSWKRGIANLNNSLGLLTGDTGNNAGARNYFEKSFSINKELDAKPFMIANMNNIGRSYQRETNFIKASEYYFRAMAIAEESGNDEQAALVGTNLTALFLTQQDYKKAASYAAITIKKAEAAHALIHEAKGYELMGIINQQANDTITARKNFEIALSIDEKLGNKLAAVSVLTNMGTLDPDPAKQITVFLKVQQILDEIAPASQNCILNLANLGLNYYDLGRSKSGHERKSDFDKSDGYLKRANALCITTNNPEYKADIMQVLSNLHAAKGNYKAALEDFKTFTSINDSIYSQENKNKIASLESQRAIDLKNREIENKELQLGNQQKKMWLLVSVIAFLISIGVLIFRQSLLRKKTNTVLLKLNNELDEANKVKAKFFGILSHDLRSPVANLINFLQLQKRKPGIMSEEQISDRESKITHSAKILLDTMDAMLLWSKGQMEHFKPSVTNVAVDDLFDYLKRFFADTPQVLFAFSNDGNLFVQTDKNYLQAIILNLTANAVKALANTQQPAITWKAWREDNNVFLTITDNGPGAGEGQLKALYDDTIGSGKNGLGLHIIRDLAKAIGCSIQLLPQAARGTSFVIGINSRAI
jgi:signal transduction histidine kinase